MFSNLDKFLKLSQETTWDNSKLIDLAWNSIQSIKNKLNFSNLTESEKYYINDFKKNIESITNKSYDSLLKAQKIINHFKNSVLVEGTQSDRTVRSELILGKLTNDIQNFSNAMSELKNILEFKEEKPKPKQKAAPKVSVYQVAKFYIDTISPYFKPSNINLIVDYEKDKLNSYFESNIDKLIKLFTNVPVALKLPDSYRSKEDTKIVNDYILAKIETQNFISKFETFAAKDIETFSHVRNKLAALKEALKNVPESSIVNVSYSE
ncbi:MAG: hypothetical protein LC122_13555 [Chitinophagales bacterium]|nr:hypothetical protein [Chitinophagales bacterium]